MSGSNLKFVTKSSDILEGDHRKLDKRDAPEQHPLDSIYRLGDKKSLRDLIHELETSGKIVHYQTYESFTSGQTVIKIDNFTYNPNIDTLFVSLCGIDLLEGINNHFIKSGPDEITMLFPMKAKYDMIILLAGTISSESYGDDIDSGIRQFRQLTDVPHSYFGSEEKLVSVNEAGTGLKFVRPKFDTKITKFDDNGNAHFVSQNNRVSFYFPVCSRGIIKGIQVQPIAPGYVGTFELKVWSEIGGYYLYYSGPEVYNILYDIMDIPFTDETGANSVYMEIYNKGQSSDFKIRVFIQE